MHILHKMELVINNRRAAYDYHLLDKYTAGIVLRGDQVRHLRDDKGASFNGAFCTVEGGEVFMRGLHILKEGEVFKLLLKKREIRKIEKDLIKGFTIVPHYLYYSDSKHYKVDIHLARGKKEFDKRETIKKRDLERSI